MIKKYTFVKREIAGDYFLVPVGEAAKKYCGLFELNEIGAFIWDRLEKNPNKIINDILSEYEVSNEQAKKDLDDFLEYLLSLGIIEKN